MLKATLLLGCALAACAPTPPITTALPLTAAVVRAPGYEAWHDRTLIVYGRARQLELQGRCEEAKSAYETYAELVRATDPASADLALAYSRSCPPRAEVDSTLSSAFTAILANDPAQALNLLDLDTRESPWRDYARGVALTDLGRTDDAARAFDQAAQAFGPGAPHGRSLAVYGKARAYHDVRWCVQAAAAYEQYAAMVRPTFPDDATLALGYARDCPIP